MDESKFLCGQYQLEAAIGRGPMASVYRAVDLKNQRQVAVKIFRSRFRTDPRFAIRFRDHLKTIIDLTHENLVAIHDYGFTDGEYYIVMEWVDGLSLRTAIAERGRLPPAQAVAIARQMCAAVAAVHQQGLVHRDLRPENILLTDEGQVKVADVGLTSLLSETGLSKTNVLLNGAGYMSPEQARGESIGPESDIYSIGILLFEMLTGRLPFESNDTWAVVGMHAEETPPSAHEINPSVPLELSQIVSQALQKDPSVRFATAQEMEATLANLPQSRSAWWHWLTNRIGPNEGLGLLAFLSTAGEYARLQYNRLQALVVNGLRPKTHLRRLLIVQYFGSFLIAFLILFFLSGQLLNGAPPAVNNTYNENTLMEAHRINDLRDRPYETHALPWTLSTSAVFSFKDSLERTPVNLETVSSDPVEDVVPANAGGGSQVGNPGGGQNQDKEKGNNEGKAKGKDKQEDKGNDKEDKGQGKENKGVGSQGKGKGRENRKK